MSELEKIYEIKDLDVERAIISLLVEDSSVRTNMTEHHMSEAFFADETSKTIFSEVLKTVTDGSELDYVILKERTAGSIDPKKLERYFTFNEFYPKKELFGEYVKVLGKNFRRNELTALTNDLKVAVQKRDDQQVSNLKKLMEEFDFSVDDGENPEIGLIENDFLAKGVVDLVSGNVKESDKSVLKTGYRLIDEGVGGFEKGNYVIIAARPSVGKSVAMINLMESMKTAGSKVMFFSGEMYAKYVLRRVISVNLNLDGDKLKFPSKMTEKEKKSVLDFVDKIKDDNDRHIYYSPKMCALDIYQHAKNIKKKHGLDAIFVDYLGKLYPNNGNMSRSRNEIVSDISRELYELAGALDIVVVTGSQLSREGAKTMADGMYVPKLTDLRDSGSLEQDADIVVGLSRDKEAAKHCVLESDATDFTLSFIKNRNGKLGDFVFNYYPTTGKLADRYDEFEKNATPQDLEKKTKSDENKALIEGLISSDSSAESIVDDIFNN